MRKKLLVVTMFLLLLVTGCEWTQTSVDSLLTPPVLIEEQQQIRDALQDEIGVGKTVSLVYPRTGDHRSAYLFCNLDEEGGDEAVVFYRLTDSSGITGTLLITLLDRIDDKWQAVWTSEELAANEVDKVIQIDENGDHLLVLGLTLFSADAGNGQQMMVFRYRNQTLERIMSQECTAHATADLNGDGKQEIVAIVKDVVGENEEPTTTASCYQWVNGRFVEQGNLSLDPQVTSYTLLEGSAGIDDNVLFLDGVKGTEQVTEMLQFRDGELVNLLAEEDTTRPLGLASMDFDEDGIIEIPLTEWVDANDESIYRVGWYQLTEEGLSLKQDTYTDFSGSYYLKWPEEYQNAVTFSRAQDGSTVTFYDRLEEVPLFMIQVFAYNALTEGGLPEQYKQLAKEGQLLYAVYIFDNESAYLPTYEQVKSAFSLF